MRFGIWRSCFFAQELSSCFHRHRVGWLQEWPSRAASTRVYLSGMVQSSGAQTSSSAVRNCSAAFSADAFSAIDLHQPTDPPTSKEKRAIGTSWYVVQLPGKWNSCSPALRNSHLSIHPLTAAGLLMGISYGLQPLFGFELAFPAWTRSILVHGESSAT